MASATSLTILEISAIFLSITALLTYVNHRFIGLPISIGAIFLGFLGFDQLIDYEVGLLEQLDFTEVLLDGML